MSIKLIGISGAARSGKDTAADYLVKAFGFRKFSFAAPIKEGVKAMFGLTEDHVNGHLKEKILDDLGVSPRFLMQTLGTEWGRKIVHTDAWLIAAQRQLSLLKEKGVKFVVIPDVRFENEASFIRDNGGVMLHVSRDDCEQVLNHESENGVSLMPGDFQVANNKTIVEFCYRVDTIFVEKLQWN